MLSIADYIFAGANTKDLIVGIRHLLLFFYGVK
ncbi:hypothetical protein SVI_1310 [Shewanella violacea DSS12]|uniref:Uncharacterized protein n=1 Tax=Shewanella violacea (strain JCM 10179 / CIP 106290 / LMG 19151 / DSS12) TaxID=637905 RepID=D4ZHY2_SHEVD|nr:hypothetical protein SVI_1310 [Shewanella violacea DSS12]